MSSIVEATFTLEQAILQLSPELILLLMGGVLLGLDALRRYWDTRRWTPYVALAGLTGALVATGLLWDAGLGPVSVLSCDRFALVINGIALVAMALVVLISSVTVQARRAPHHGAFYALLLLAALAICLLGAAGDLVVVVLAFELFGVASSITAGYLRGDPRASEAAVKAFLYHAVASALMLCGLSYFYGVAGSTELAAITDALSGAEASLRPVLLPAMVLLVAGFAFKVAAAPFHQWAPDVYEGTSAPVVALFAVGPVLAGVAGLTRVVLTVLPVGLQTLDVDLGILLGALAAFTVIFGNLFALWQQNVRRFLAYLAIAQAGYLLIGVAACLGIARADHAPAEVAAISQQGVVATLYGLIAYVLGGLGALAAILALSRHTGSFDIESYAGMHRRSPELAWSLLACLLSLVGLPPTAGFIGRLYLFSAGVRAGALWLVIVGAVGGVISLACVWKVIRVLFVAPAVAGPARSAGRLAVSPMLAVALGVGVVGVFAAAIFADPLLALLQAAARALAG